MRALLRFVFVVLIALGLATQALRAGHGGGDPNPKATLIGRLAALGVRGTDLPGTNFIEARSALCAQPFVVAILHVDGRDDETVRPFVRPDVVMRYLYLGTVEPHPSQLRLTARSRWAALLYHVGLRNSLPPDVMAMVAWPRSCPRLAAVDWTALSPWQ
jgi:hypothetical protein